MCLPDPVNQIAVAALYSLHQSNGTTMASPSSLCSNRALASPAISPVIAPAEILQVFSRHTRRLLVIAVACWVAGWLLFVIWSDKAYHGTQAQTLLNALCFVNFITAGLTLARLLQTQERGHRATLSLGDSVLFHLVGVLSTGHWLLVESAHHFVYLF